MHITNICILGGTGFVGQHLVAKLVGKGYRTRVLTRHIPAGSSLLVIPRVELIECDTHNADVLKMHFKGMDCVINLVGILNEDKDTGTGFNAAHVEFSRKVVDACLANGIGRLLHMSALNADAENGSSYYLLSKGKAENQVHAAAAKGLQVTSFRPSVIYGPGDSFFNRFASLLRLTPLVFPLACANAQFSPVYIGDVVEAFIRTINDKNSWGQRYDLCGPASYTLKELVRYTDGIIHQHHIIVGLPDVLSRLQARIFQHLPGKPFTMDNYRSMQMPSICERNGLEELGIHPTAIESVVPRYLGHKGVRNRYDAYRKTAHRG